MPSLEEILKKTKAKSEQINIIRKPVTIAEQDRPYTRAEITDTPSPTVLNNTLLDNVQEKIKPNTNPTQTQHNLNSAENNQTQSKHKANTKLTQKQNTNSTQSRHDVINYKGNHTQTQHKVDTKPNTQKTQTQHKLNTNYAQSTHISTLIGVQRNILLFIFEECKKARSHITEPLSILHISSNLEIAIGSIKTSIARLCEKNFIKINSFKNGRGGWSVYEIPDNIYNELLQMETKHKLYTNQTQTIHKVDTKLNTQPNTSLSSSSSLNINKTTTTELSTEWNFDISPYARFGFTSSQLKQVAALGVISAADVEQSLIEFSYDLDNNALPSIKTNKINFLMGLLRAGHSYVSEGFKNEQEALIAEMVRRAEDKRKKGLEEKFIAWEMKLSEEEREEIKRRLPTSLIVLYRAHGMNNPEVRNWLFDYFLNYAR